MFGLKHHQHAERLESLDHGIGNLAGKTLLHLQTMGKAIHAASNLREASNAPTARYIGDVRHSNKGQNMVLTHRGKRDIANDDHLFVVALAKLAHEWLGSVDLCPAKKLLAGTRNTIGRTLQAFAVGILANR